MLMLKRLKIRRGNGEAGHSLVEAALMMPIVLSIAFNAVNVGWFWFMVLQLSAVPRHAVQYSTQGGAAMKTVSASPLADDVSTLAYNNLLHTIGATTSNASVQVCTVRSGTTSNVANCTAYGPSATFPAMEADPEAPYFAENRVTVRYTVTPLIPGTVFHVLLPSNLTFYRQVSMRSLYI